MRVVAVDPGKMTGIAWYIPEGPPPQFERVFVQELPWQEAMDMLVQEIGLTTHSGSMGLDAVVCEEYRISARSIKTARDTTSLEGTGVLRWACARYKVPFVLQTPADAMSFVTNDKLKLLGPEWYARGKEHGRDAVRHLVLYLTRTGGLDRRRLIG